MAEAIEDDGSRGRAGEEHYQEHSTMNALTDLESKASGGVAFTREDVDRVVAFPDLVSVGVLGAMARRAAHGGRVTYGRVAVVASGFAPSERGQAGEVRLTGTPSSPQEAIAWTRAAVEFAGGVLVTGFSLSELAAIAGNDHIALAELATALHASGLEGIASIPVDELGDDPAELVRAVMHGGLSARRATITAAGFAERLDLIERVVALQRETGALRAFAPLPRVDPADAPSTGYDDVKTIAAARLMAASIPHIQVDWILYGPKLAQVAIEYGADDIDAVLPFDVEHLGVRRSPQADIERQIRSAFAEPAERNGRYETTEPSA
jgi:hypothetical protein